MNKLFQPLADTGTATMPILILDPFWAEKARQEIYEGNPERPDEVWEGVLVVPPMANNEHQRMGFTIAYAIRDVIGPRVKDIFAGCNISDREEGWTINYRIPDVAVFLPGNSAKDCDTHWMGGPDFLVEILSAGDRAEDKFPFYASVGVREILLIDRDPWRLLLYRRGGDDFVEAGRVESVGVAPLSSSVLPVSFTLTAGEERPDVVITSVDGRTWLA